MEITNIQAEMSVLITAIRHTEPCSLVLESLTCDHFHTTEHRAIFQAMREISNRGHVIDEMSVENELRSLPDFTKIMTFFPESSDLGSIPKLEQNISTIKECHKKFLGLNFVKKFTKDYNEKTLEELRQILDDHLDTIEPTQTDTLKSVIQNPFLGCESAADFVNKGWIAKQTGQEFFKGVKTGYPNLDEAVGGMMEGDYILIGGRPGSGKTSFALNIIKNVIDQGNKVGFISLEMTSEQIVLKLLSRGSGISYKKILMGQYENQFEVDMCLSYLKILESENLFIESAANGNVGTVVSKIKKLKRVHDIKLVCIDYIGLMSSGQKGMNRADTITEVSEQLRQVFKTLKLPGIVLAQLNRNSVNEGRKPVKEDIRDSDRPVENAHQIWLIHRIKGDNNIQPYTEVILDKVRIAENATVYFTSNGALFTPRDNIKDLQEERVRREYEDFTP